MSPVNRLREWRDRELTWSRLVRLAAVTLQLALLVAVIRSWNIETQAFENVAMLVLGGFLIHHFLPLSMRLPFFSLLSVASILMVFGLHAGLSILGVGTVLIVLSHVPVAFGIRTALILATAAGLALARIGPGWMPAAVRWALPGSIWPILGSMFMFRLIAYLYDVRHRTAPVGPWRALGYFFMIPNICFPLFPVVDYQTFNRNYYNDDPIRIYGIGLKWILRGIVQLLMYRFVYMYCVIDPSRASDALDVGRYMLTTYLLYLKISGSFHMIVGMLHLFGFNLPETHHLYLLSSSFTDFWRRINIYWKDFITKVVFYPLYFRWRKLGDARAVILATLGAFIATWFLHSYQWFWIRGTFPIVWSDLVFWLGLGLIVTLNVRWEQRHGRRRSLKTSSRGIRDDIGLMLRTAGTFTAICILWTIWSTPSSVEMHVLLEAATRITVSQALVLLGVPLAVGATTMFLGRRPREDTDGKRTGSIAPRSDAGFWPGTLRTASVCAILLLVYARPDVLLFQPRLAAAATELQSRGLNKTDLQNLHRGYYEELGDVTRFDNELWRMYGLAPKDWGAEMPVNELRDDALIYSYMKNLNGPFKGVPFSTNSHGLRDREYSVEKPPDAFRLALLGASHDVGSGVRNEETYENVAESLLNDQWAKPGQRFEILNFSVSGYAPLQKLAAAEILVPEYHPDVVLYAANSHELDWTFYTLDELMKRGLVDDYPFLVDAMRRAGLDPRGDPPPRTLLSKQLEPEAPAALGGLLKRFAASVRAYGAEPVLVLVEFPMDDKRPDSFDVLTTLGRAAGVDVIDLYGALGSVEDRSKLWIAPWDDHTNPLGHRLLGGKLVEGLLQEGVVPVEGAARGEGPGSALVIERSTGAR